MGAADYILALDCGLTFCKAVIFDARGRIIAIEKTATPVLNPRPGWSEINMDDHWNNVSGIIQRVLKKSGIAGTAIGGIGVSGHGNGVYCLDRNGKPTGNAVTSMDQRAGQVVRKCEALKDGWSGQPGVILSWIKRNQPERYRKIRTAFFCKDWVVYCLTGRIGTDFSDASAAGLLDNMSREYDCSVLNALGIEEMSSAFPKPVRSFDITGHVCKTAAQQTGMAVGTPVVAGMFDGDACGYGCGATTSGTIASVAGTWNLNIVHSNDFVAPDSIRQCILRGDGEGYALIDSSPTSAINFEWLLNNVWDGKFSYEDMSRVLADYNYKALELLYLPFVNGSLDDSDIGGAFVNLRITHGTDDMLAACVEGVAFAHCWHIRNLQKLCGDAECIRLTGGAAGNPQFCQLIADVTGMNVEQPESSQTGATGIWAAVSVGQGRYPSMTDAVDDCVRIKARFFPDLTRHEVYLKKFEQFRKLVTLLS